MRMHAARYQAAKVMKKQVAKERKEQESAARLAAMKERMSTMTPEEKAAWDKQRLDVRQVWAQHVGPCPWAQAIPCDLAYSAGEEAGRPAEARPHAAGAADRAAHRDRPGL